MGFNFKYVKITAVVQLVIGILVLLCGIVIQATHRDFHVDIYRKPYYSSYNYYYKEEFTAQSAMGIWIGALFIVAGLIGIAASRPRRHSDSPRVPVVASFMGFSIMASIFAFVMIVCYAIILDDYYKRGCEKDERGYRKGSNGYTSNNYNYNYRRYYRTTQRPTAPPSKCNTGLAMNSLVLACAVVEMFVSIWSAVLCCHRSTCQGCNDCCYPSPPAQVIYLQSAGNMVPAQAGNVLMAQTGSALPTGNLIMAQTGSNFPAGSVPLTLTAPAVQGIGSQGQVMMITAAGQPGQSNMADNPPAYSSAVERQSPQAHDNKVYTT